MSIKRHTVLDIPSGARVLSVGLKGTTPCVWMEVDPDGHLTEWDFWCFTTGASIPTSVLEHGTYLDTVVIEDVFVAHYYTILPTIA